MQVTLPSLRCAAARVCGRYPAGNIVFGLLVEVGVQFARALAMPTTATEIAQPRHRAPSFFNRTQHLVHGAHQLFPSGGLVRELPPSRGGEVVKPGKPARKWWSR